MAILQYDEEAARRLLAVYTTPDIEQQRIDFINSIDLTVDEKVLDVGSGPGFLARKMAEKVGIKGKVWGIDISDFLLDLAKSKNEDLSSIDFKYGDATNTEFANEEFDTVVCTQVLEYVHDVDAALNEFNRVLKKGGKIALLDTDWDSIVWNSNDTPRMSEILKAWEAHATYPRLPRTLTSKMINSGFNVEKVAIIPLLNPSYDPNTYSNRMIDLIVPFVVENGDVNQQMAEAWARELRNIKSYFFSLNRYLFVGRKI